MQYAHITNDIVNIIECEPDKVDELISAGLVIKDISEVTPKPAAGWTYDPDTDTYSEPEPIIEQPNPVISNIDFWERFTEDEREILVTHTNAKIKRFLFELRLRDSFDLSDQKNIDIINALESATIIGVGRADVILSY